METDLTKRIHDRIKDRIICITGGTGSLGYVLTERLIRDYEPQEIRVLWHSTVPKYEAEGWLEQQFGTKKVKKLVRYLQSDVKDPSTLTESIRGANIIFHLASMKDVADCEDYPEEAHRINVVGSNNLLEEVLKWNDAECVIGASTDKACDPGDQVYGKTKQSMERLFLAAHERSKALRKETKFSLVRGGNFLGSRKSVIDKWLRAARDGRPLEIRDTRMRRFSILLSEAVDLYLWVVANSGGGEIFTREMPVFKLERLLKTFQEIISSTQNIEVKIEPRGAQSGERPNEYLISTQNEIPFTREEPYPYNTPYLQRNRSFRIFVCTPGNKPKVSINTLFDTRCNKFLLTLPETKNMLTQVFKLPWLK